jgi:hypothetical protein
VAQYLGAPPMQREGVEGISGHLLTFSTATLTLSLPPSFSNMVATPLAGAALVMMKADLGAGAFGRIGTVLLTSARGRVETNMAANGQDRR